MLSYELPEELGYSQRYYSRRTAHLVEVKTDEGITGWGECFGPGNVAVANKAIVEKVIQSLIVGEDPINRDAIWHKVHNLLRDHGQKGMPLQALSGVDIALWDITGKLAGLPIHKLIGGAHRNKVASYGYGMMLKRESTENHIDRFKDEAAQIKEMGFVATIMKVDLGRNDDVKLCETVRNGVGYDYPFIADANHCYTTADAFYLGRALDELDAYWFEEPVAPENPDGYRELRAGLKVNISGEEAGFVRWCWQKLLESRWVRIARLETSDHDGITVFLRVLAVFRAHFVTVVKHAWGLAIAVATNLQRLASIPHMPRGLFQSEPWLEFDTTDSRFRDKCYKHHSTFKSR